MIEFCENKNIDIVFYFYAHCDWYRELIEKINSRRSSIIDTGKQRDESVDAIPDGHPNTFGHKKIMSDIYDFLIEYLKVSS